MDHTLLVLQLVVGLAVLSFVRQNVAGTSYRAAPGFMDNGHTAKKSPMDYSRYAADERDIGSHSGVSSFRGLNECDSRYELKNSSIIRTKDSLNNGAEFVGDTKVDGAAECRWRCCQKEGSCDTAIFVEDESKSKNCFLFRCWHEGTLKCLFSSHWGYVSAIIGGFDDLPPTSQVVSEDDPALTGDEDFHHSVENLQSKDAMNPDEPKGHTEDDAECGTGQIQCASGECIVVRYICNGVDDCTDGSDEMGCKYGTWRHWNDYNHGDDGNTYQPRIQDGYNHNGRDGKVEYRPDEADSGGARGGEQTSEDFVDYGSNTKVEGDKETTEDDDEVYIATVAKEHDELPTVPSVPTAQPHPPATAESNSFHTDGRQSSVVTTTRTDHNEQSDQDSSNKVEPFGSHPATSAILPLAVGLIITLLLLMMLSCRLRYMNRRLRYGRLKTHAHDADYLINGMYL